MNKISYVLVSIIMVLGFSGCGKYEAVPNMAKLKVSFADAKWDGIRVPKNEVCARFNSEKAQTPKLLIKNLPIRTNKIILSFSDETYTPMSNGGHGVLSYEVKENTKNVEIDSVSSESFELPKNMESIQAHMSARNGNGAYLAPCSGGRGNTYSIKIEAIHDFNVEGKKSLLLGEAYLKMGTY